jgi:hypothetical protein
MQLSSVLDTVIGLSFIFFLLSTACSAVVEAIATFLKKRAKYLLRGLRQLLDGDGPTAAGRPQAERRAAEENRFLKAAKQTRLVKAANDERTLHEGALAEASAGSGAASGPAPAGEGEGGELGQPATKSAFDRVISHPLVAAQVQRRSGGEATRFPSYLSARTVAAAIIDALVPDAAGEPSMPVVMASIDRSDLDQQLKDALRAVARSAQDRGASFVSQLEAWYDDQMARIAGQYKRWSKRWILVIAAALVLVLHVDALALTRDLWNEPSARQAAVAVASPAACDDARPGTSKPAQGNGTPGQNTQADYLTCLRDEASKLTASGVSIGVPSGCPGDLKDCLFPRGPTYATASYLSVLLGLLLSVLAASLGAPFWFEVLNRFGSLRNTGTKPPTSIDQK